MNEISVANASWKSEFWLPEKANRKFIYLRPWQKESFNQLKDEMFRWVVAPPGSGKTTLMSLLAYNDVVNKDIDKVVIVVPQNSIKRNYSKIRINLNGNEIKLSPIIVEANNVSRLTRFLKSDLSNLKINSRVIVCTHQTMCRIDDELIKGNISVWVDEAHHLSFDSEESNVLGGKIKIAIKNCRSVNIATATPARHDGAKLVCDRAKFAEYTLTIDKHIKMHTKIESMHFNVVKYKQSATECITELYKRSKEPTIIWIPSIRSLPSYGEDCKYKFTSEIAKAISPRHELIDTEYGWTINGLVVVNLVDEMNRKEKLELISSGSIDTIIALEMFKEGDDCPKLSRGIKIGIRSSLVVNNQMNGRLFRHFDGKNKIEVYQVIQEIDAKRSIRDKVGKLISVMVLSIVDIESIIGQPTIIMNKKKFKTGTIWEDYFGDKSVSIRAELIRDILSFGNFNDSKEYIFSWCDSNGIIEDDKFRIVASALSYMASNTKALNKLTKIIDLDLIDQDDLFGWYSKSIDCEYLHKLRVFRDLEEMKKRLIEMARSGEPKPKHNELMYRYLRRFCHEYELGYDKEVHDKLLSLRPDWFEDQSERSKQELIDMARSGSPRPVCDTREYNVFNYYCIDKKYRDEEFTSFLKKLRPDWFLTKTEIKIKMVKQELLDLAMSGAPRPNRSEHHRLYRAMLKYIKKDKNFRDELQNLRPDWFIDPVTQNKNAIQENLLELAKSGVERPKRGSEYYFHFMRHYRNHEDFRNKMQGLRPDWAISKTEILDEKLLELAKSGAERPKYNTKLGAAICSRKEWLKDVRPDWFETETRKDRLIAYAKSGGPRPNPKIDQNLYAAFYNICNKKGTQYDNEVTSEVKKMCPDWFTKKKTSKQLKEELFELLENGLNDRPKVNTQLGRLISRSISINSKWYDVDIHMRLMESRSHWFRDICNEFIKLASKSQTVLNKELEDILMKNVKQDTSLESKIGESRPDWLNKSA